MKKPLPPRRGGGKRRILPGVLLLLLPGLIGAMPPAPRPAFQVEEVSRMIDGIPGNWIELAAADTLLRWYPHGNWILAESHGPEVSVEFYDRSFPKLRMQLLLFRAGSWLENLDRASLQLFIASLREAHAESDVEILNPRSHEPEIGTPPFLNGTYRKVFYRVTSKAPVETTDYCDVLSLTDAGHLLVLRIFGPERPMAFVRRNIDTELSAFEER